MKIVNIIIIFVILFSANFAFADNFTPKDRELLIELKVKVHEIDKRFEQIDKRLEQINNRFSDILTFLWIITGIFVTLTGTVIGFAYWDRRTVVKKAA